MSYVCRSVLLCSYIQRRVMELKRASLIIGTPPSTPRNSMLLAAAPPSNSSQMFDLSEFLSKFDPGDTPGTIPEDEEFHQLTAAPTREFRTSQQSVSQRSKSSSSLHSAPSQTSISSKNDSMPVIINPAANANFNNNNNPTLSLIFSESSSQVSGPSSSTPTCDSTNGLADMLWKDNNSQSYTGDIHSRHSLANDQLSLTEALAFLEPLNEEDAVMKRSASVSTHNMSKSKSSDALKKDAKPKSKSKGLFKKNFHRSTEGVIAEQKFSGKPPVGKPFKTGKKNSAENTKRPILEVPHVNEKRRSTPNLSALTDINQVGDSDQPLFKTEKRKSLENIQVKDEADPFSEVDDCFSSLSQPTSITSIISEEDSLWQEYGPF